MEKTGVPSRVLGAYGQFLEGMEVHNTIASGLGQAYQKPTSIQQGDPLSMMVAALATRPWVMQMKGAAVEPRVFADDLHIMAAGPRNLELFEHAFNATHKHLRDMGARIAPIKCTTFISDRVASKWLKTYRWRRLRSTVLVVTDLRDLGVHLNATMRKKRGTTLTTRMRGAAQWTSRLRRM